MAAHPISAEVAIERMGRLPSDNGFSDIIDARTEDEFALDHLPGAVNWPSLTNEERIRVGTLYKQVSPFEANKIGAMLVASNIARHIEHSVMELPKDWQPLIYCWRGGKRSGSLASTENNLIQMVTACYKAKAAVLLIGMQVPPNYGQEYAQEFSRMFVRISQQQRTQLVPFMLKGVADAADPTALFQPDRIHPKAQAHPIILSNVWPVLKRML